MEIERGELNNAALEKKKKKLNNKKKSHAEIAKMALRMRQREKTESQNKIPKNFFAKEIDRENYRFVIGSKLNARHN